MDQDVPTCTGDEAFDHWCKGIKKSANSFAAVSNICDPDRNGETCADKDGAVYLGYKAPQHWTKTGGQPPSTHAWSASGTYYHLRQSDDSYDTCQDAIAALDLGAGRGEPFENATAAQARDPPTPVLPFKNWDNTDPSTTEFSSSLGSSLFVGAETTIWAKAEDPDETDEVKLTMIIYGVAPEQCDWPQCNSKTLHAQGVGSANISIPHIFPNAGRFVVRVIATDFQGGMQVQDIPFLVFKTGDTNFSAPCCRYNMEVISCNSGTSPAGSLHRSQWTGQITTGELYKEALFDYGIHAPHNPLDRVQWLTCKGTHHGSRTSHIAWHTSINKFTGTQTRYVLLPTATGDAYDHPWLEYLAANQGENTGCTRDGTRVLIEEGLAAEMNSQFFIRWSFGRFSLGYNPDIAAEILDDPGNSEGAPYAMNQHPECAQCGDGDGTTAGQPSFYRHCMPIWASNPRRADAWLIRSRILAPPLDRPAVRGDEPGHGQLGRGRRQDVADRGLRLRGRLDEWRAHGARDGARL